MLLVGLIAGSLGWLFGGPSIGLLFGLFAGLITTLIAGFFSDELSVLDYDAQRPKRNNVVFGLIAGLRVGLPFGLICGLLFGLINGLYVGLFAGLLSGLLVGLLIWLNFGLGAVLHQQKLLAFLRCCRAIPKNYAQFLDYATERIFLYKVGRGYIFIHRLLLDYFASPNLSEGTSQATEQRQFETNND